MNGIRPAGPIVLGSGPLADSVRARLEADPDRYTPETWSIDPVGHCPCCDEDVFSCTTRHTGWSEGFATHTNLVHPRCNAQTAKPDLNGTLPGCCCVAPNFGPMHAAANESKISRERRRYRTRR